MTNLMNLDYDYDGVVANQIRTYAHIGMFESPPAEEAIADLPTVPDPTDSSQPLELRARSYMNSNCAHCHQPLGSAVSAILRDLRYETPLIDTALCTGVVAGNAEASELWIQVDELKMPPIAVHVPDHDAKVVREWLAELQSCP